MNRNHKIAIGVSVALVAALLAISVSNRFTPPARPRGTDTPRQTLVHVFHFVVPSAKSFDEVVAAVEANTPRADVPAFELSSALESAPDGKQKSDIAADKDALVIVGRSDIGERQAKQSGKAVRARVYLLGNPVGAARMIEHDPAAALYVPLRLLVYEDAQGKTRLAYDKISTAFAQYRNGRLVTAAQLLDEQLEDLVDKAAK
jgi:uncharacterized protein (DUF302 family)